jgi:hypothetical protein
MKASSSSSSSSPVHGPHCGAKVDQTDPKRNADHYNPWWADRNPDGLKSSNLGL